MKLILVELDTVGLLTAEMTGISDEAMIVSRLAGAGVPGTASR